MSSLTYSKTNLNATHWRVKWQYNFNKISQEKQSIADLPYASNIQYAQCTSIFCGFYSPFALIYKNK
jgi:hypothetical protein